MVQLAKNAPCCYKLINSWCCALVLSIPFGGLSGLSFSMYGIAWFYDGLERFTNALEDLGVRNASKIIALFDWAVIIMMIANVLVVMYGFREKCRYRKGLFHHFSWRDLGFDPPCCLSCILLICSPCFLKFLLKSLIHLVVITSVGLWLLSAFIVELIWIIFQAIDAICSGTSGGDVQDVLDLIHGDANESVDEICDAMQDAKAGSGIVFVGCLIIVISQIIVVAYCKVFFAAEPYFAIHAGPNIIHS